MDTENSSLEDKVEDVVVIKHRLSLFNPNLPVDNKDTEPKESVNECFTKYSNKLISERELWKQIYKDSKDSNQCLRKELEKNATEKVFFSSLNEEDMEFERNRPNFYKFVKQVNELQEHAQTLEEQFQRFRSKKQYEFRNLQSKIDVLKQICLE